MLINLKTITLTNHDSNHMWGCFNKLIYKCGAAVKAVNNNIEATIVSY